MLPIKILCECGQKYAFDIEPSTDNFICAVRCPVCGADGSEATNQIVQQYLATQTPSPPALQIRGGHPNAAFNPSPALEPPRARPVPSPAGHGNTRNRSLFKAIGACAILIVLAICAAIFNGYARIKKQSPPATASAIATDLPNTVEELNSWYVEPAPGHNAATINLRAFAALHSSPFKLPQPSAPLRASTKSALEALVNSNRSALDFLHESVRHDQSRYPVDLNQGFETVLPHLIKFKDAARLTEYSATLNAEQHRGKEAGDDILAGLALGRSLQLEPILLSQFIRAVTVSTAVSALEQTINRTVLPPDQLNVLAVKFERLEQNEARGDAFNRALAGERATALSIMRNPGNYLKKINQSGTAMKPQERDQWIACLKNATNFREEVRYYEDSFQQLMTAREKPFPARLQADRLMRQRLDEAKSHGMAMNDFLMPGRAGTAAKEASCLAYFRLGLVALALEQFRTTHGKQYPATLSNLPASPEVLRDPFDGELLRYERKGQGYLLYSIGPDLNDDAGERTHGKDLVFEVAGFADQ
jgi:hypothetical protein